MELWYIVRIDVNWTWFFSTLSSDFVIVHYCYYYVVVIVGKYIFFDDDWRKREESVDIFLNLFLMERSVEFWVRS